MNKRIKGRYSFGCTSKWEFNFSPLHSGVIYHPWRSSPSPQEVKRKCNRKRRWWMVWSSACKSRFFYEAGPPWKMKCSCCERKQWSGTHVITLTPRRGSASNHPQDMAPMCSLGLKHHQPLTSKIILPPHMRFCLIHSQFHLFLSPSVQIYLKLLHSTSLTTEPGFGPPKHFLRQ